MDTRVHGPSSDEPIAEFQSPSARYWAAIALLILGLLGGCGALIIIAALHR